MCTRQLLDISKTLIALGNLGVGEEVVSDYRDLLSRIRASRVEEQHALLTQAVDVALDTLGFAPNEDAIRDHDDTVSWIESERRRCAGE